jgi:Heterokaryon incompatibility protein (HET)
VYKKLEPSSICLLAILPGFSSDPIKCALAENMPLNLLGDNPVSKYQLPGWTQIKYGYEALSYTWGSPEPKQVAHIANTDDHTSFVSMTVTLNLYSALRHLRRTDDIRTLWIDALCINQADAPEKSDQVREMMKIYANADRVIVWLGEEADDSYMAIKAIEMLNHEESREALFNCQHEHVCLSQLTKLYNALICLYERPWFSRVWIWQEVMVARDLVVCCGTSQTSWKPLKRAARRLWQLRAMIQPSPDHELRSISTSRLELIKMLKQG